MVNANEYEKTSYEQAMSIVRNAFVRRLSMEELEEDRLAIYSYIGTEFSLSRFYLAIDRDLINNVWNKIRVNVKLCDFLLALTVDLRTQFNFLSDMSWDSLVELIAISNGQFRQSADYVAIDVDFYERVTTRDKLKVLYDANPWFVVIILLQMAVAFTETAGTDKVA